MIIVEGPDGSGKDTLIDRLLHDFRIDLIRGPRAVKSSTSGPVDNLGDWMITDFDSWRYRETCNIYNRYPLISEPIYGPRLRGHFQPGFLDTKNLLTPLVSKLALVIFCLPPLELVTQNVSKERDMPGVAQNIKSIYRDYEATQKGWPGWNVIYDYTKVSGRGSYSSIVRATMNHLSDRRKGLK